MSPYRNVNLIELQRLVTRMGGRITCRRTGGKHFVVYLETAKGNKTKLTLSKGPMRAGSVSFYLKRAFREADRAPTLKR